MIEMQIYFYVYLYQIQCDKGWQLYQWHPPPSSVSISVWARPHLTCNGRLFTGSIRGKSIRAGRIKKSKILPTKDKKGMYEIGHGVQNYNMSSGSGFFVELHEAPYLYHIKISI